MTILIAGASGATGRLLVQQLLDRGHHVKAIVRSPEKMPGHLKGHEHLDLIRASIPDMSNSELAKLTQGCHAVASCLGHNPTFKGILMPPYRLVTKATRNLCAAIKANAPEQPVKFVLMNTVGNRNRDLREQRSFAERIVIVLLRLLVPPHPDNEQAAEYLRTVVGQKNDVIEWAVVRPDTLIDSDLVTEYSIHPSPTRSAIFNPGKTSRINVAHFMAELICDQQIWEQWKGKMPVVYNT